jgi:membrane protein implicated in regulation of membrane protease activity
MFFIGAECFKIVILTFLGVAIIFIAVAFLLLDFLGLFLLLLVIGLGVSVLLLHEFLPSLKRSALDVFRSLREQITEVSQMLVRTTHKDNVWQLLVCVLFVGFG